jgi:hypothetical protein
MEIVKCKTADEAFALSGLGCILVRDGRGECPSGPCGNIELMLPDTAVLRYTVHHDGGGKTRVWELGNLNLKAFSGCAELQGYTKIMRT